MNEPKEQLYVSYRGDKIDGYTYGEEWVAMALYCGDMKYPTPEEAKAAWVKWKEDRSNGKC